MQYTPHCSPPMSPKFFTSMPPSKVDPLNEQLLTSLAEHTLLLLFLGSLTSSSSLITYVTRLARKTAIQQSRILITTVAPFFFYYSFFFLWFGDLKFPPCCRCWGVNRSPRLQKSLKVKRALKGLYLSAPITLLRQILVDDSFMFLMSSIRLSPLSFSRISSLMSVPATFSGYLDYVVHFSSLAATLGGNPRCVFLPFTAKPLADCG